MSDETISEEYKRLNQELHETNESYGTSGHVHAESIELTARQMGANSILDYGCGKQTLREKIPHVKGYDPCIPGLDKQPKPVDLVACTDVLEHIEPDYLDAVLAHIKSLAKMGVFIVVHTGPAVKQLSDGRNAHLIQENIDWWLPKLSEYFEPIGAGDDGQHVFFIGVTGGT